VDGVGGPCGSCVIASQQCDFAPARRHGKASDGAVGRKRKVEVEEYESEDGGHEATFDVDEEVDELSSGGEVEERKPIVKRFGKVSEASNASPSKRQRTAVASSPLKNASAGSSRSMTRATTRPTPQAGARRTSVAPSSPAFLLDGVERRVEVLVERYLDRLQRLIGLERGLSEVGQRALLDVVADIREVVGAACRASQ
jgi:hypothetical protein